MRIYLDNCCLNRPFDDQSSPRIHLESEAIKIILSKCEKGEWTLLSSDITFYEINKTPDETRRRELSLVVALAKEHIQLMEHHLSRTREFEKSGLSSFDALHLSCAESKTDIFLTVDDGIIKKVRSIKSLKIKVLNPITWLEEILQ